MKKLVLSLSLASLLITSIGITTLASENTPNTTNNESINQVNNLSNEDLNLQERKHFNLTSKLNKIDEDVSNGILTAEEAETMKKSLSENCANRNLTRKGNGCGLRDGNGNDNGNGLGHNYNNCK